MKPIPMMFVASSLLVLACGPSSRAHTGGDDDGTIDAAGTTSCVMGSPEVCDDGIDNDCDGLADCDDPDCSGVGTCPICGMVQHPVGNILPLPDGEDAGQTCSTNAQCTSPAEPNCIDGLPTPTCANSYVSKVNFTGFAANQAITAISNIVSVCVNMEHSYLGDLQIEIMAPSGQVLGLQEFQGEGVTGQIYLGHPVDDDSQPNTPGTGMDYCWTPGATNAPMVMYASTHSIEDSSTPLPAGNYQTSQPWTKLIGAQLNGDWAIRVTDRWPSDNGFIFSWSIAFDPTIVTDCSGPVIQ